MEKYISLGRNRVKAKGEVKKVTKKKKHLLIIH